MVASSGGPRDILQRSEEKKAKREEKKLLCVNFDFSERAPVTRPKSRFGKKWVRREKGKKRKGVRSRVRSRGRSLLLRRILSLVRLSSWHARNAFVRQVKSSTF